MDNLLNMISSVNDEKSHNDNMYVNNIIVKKNDPTKNKDKLFPYIPTEKWVKQLGERLIAYLFVFSNGMIFLVEFSLL